MRVLVMAFLLLFVIVPDTNASPKGIVDLLQLLMHAGVNTSVRLSDDVIKKVREGRELTPDELEQVRAFGRLIEASRLETDEITLLDARGQPLPGPEEQHLLAIRQEIAPHVDDFIQDMLVAGKTELSKEAIAAEFSKRLAAAPARQDVQYSFDIVTGELTLVLKRADSELKGRVNLYDKLLAVGVAVLGYQVLDTSEQAGQSDQASEEATTQPKSSSRSGSADDSAVLTLLLLLSGVVCALWAQYSGRSGLLWFVLGFVLSVFTWIALLYLTRRDLRTGRTRR